MLNPNQKKFCMEYVMGIDAGNKARSYSKAYNNQNLNSCSTNAIVLLKKPEVQEYIAQLEDEYKKEIFSQVRKRLAQAVKTSAEILNDSDHKQFGTVMAQIIKLIQISDKELSNPAQDFNLNITFEEE